MCKKLEVQRCGCLVRFDVTRVDEHTTEPGEDAFRTCLRPAGHEGPHLITDHCGRFITWEYDRERACSDCQSEDPNDWCLIYNEISKADAHWLRNSLRPIYDGSPEEWIQAGTAVLKSLPVAVRNNHLGQYFFCNIRDGTYVIGKTCDVATAQYASKHFLPSEGWTIFGIIIQAQHL